MALVVGLPEERTRVMFHLAHVGKGTKILEYIL